MTVGKLIIIEVANGLCENFKILIMVCRMQDSRSSSKILPIDKLDRDPRCDHISNGIVENRVAPLLNVDCEDRSHYARIDDTKTFNFHAKPIIEHLSTWENYRS